MKKVYYLRSTSIVNDSRATKEIDYYVEKGYEVVVLGWNRHHIEIPNNDKVKYKMFKIKSRYGDGIKNILKLATFQLWLYFNILFNKNSIDIIHACDFDTAFIASKAYNKRKTKFIYDIYDYYVDSHNTNFLKSTIEKLDIKLINKSNLVIICTEQRREQIKKSNPKELAIVHNSPDIKFESKDKKYNPQNIKICFVGVLQDDRLIEEIVSAVEQTNGLELHIGGFGKYEQLLIDKSKQTEKIKFYGQMNYEDVLKLESECDILFATYNPQFPNHKYSAPNKVYEAMALGKPIIVCKNTGIDDIVSKEKIGYAIDYDAKQFIEVVKNIDEESYRKMSIRSKSLYAEKYSWNKMKDVLSKHNI